MIGFRDSLTLARTKLYARPVLLVLTLLVCGMLFGVLNAGIHITTGAIASARAFALEASGGKYLVKVNPVIPSEVYTTGNGSGIAPSVQKRLKELLASYIAEHKALAKQLGVPFDEASVPEPLLPNPYADPLLPADQRMLINPQSPALMAYLSEQQAKYAQSAPNSYVKLQALAKQYGATDFYENDSAGVYFGNMMYLPGGKEDLTDVKLSRSPVGDPYIGAAYLSSVQNSDYTFVSNDLIGRYVLPVNDRRRVNSTAIPVVITTTEAVQLFGKQYNLPAEPALPKDRIAWLNGLQDKLNGITYTACYRNQADLDQLVRLNQVASEIEQNRTTPGYIKPSVIYGLPATPCGDRVVKTDTRTTAERLAEQQQADIQLKLGLVEAPQRQLVPFVVVGIMPVQRDDQMYSSITAFVSRILSANFNQGAIIPQQLYAALPVADRHEDIMKHTVDETAGTKAMVAAGLMEHIVSFPSVGQARRFMSEQACAFELGDCTKQYTANPYATNYLLFDDVQGVVSSVVQIALPATLGLAGLVVALMMVRIMIDSRRETAVFRAIGAKRIDIASIYLTYTVMVALGVALVGAGIGTILAGALQLAVGGDITAYAKVAYGVFGSHHVFDMVGVYSALDWQIVLGIVGISVVAVLLPLLRNVRRDPITDMRDE